MALRDHYETFHAEPNQSISTRILPAAVIGQVSALRGVNCAEGLRWPLSWLSRHDVTAWTIKNIPTQSALGLLISHIRL